MQPLWLRSHNRRNQLELKSFSWLLIYDQLPRPPIALDHRENGLPGENKKILHAIHDDNSSGTFSLVLAGDLFPTLIS